ncbi:MAG: signal peptidase II [Oscillospiraceae bacterium]|nr:signal peptidase II [Oscillospiraceae bacterium]
MVRYLAMLLGAGAIVVLDQLSKFWITGHIQCRAYQVAGQVLTCAQSPGLPATAPVWDGVVHLTHYHNTGMAFSLLEGARWLFLVLTALVLALAALVVVKKWITHPLALTALTMIAGGGVGNMIDRALHGAVVDMIEVEFMNFAIFNVADCFVVAGTILLAVWAVFLDRNKPKAPGEAADDRSL